MKDEFEGQGGSYVIDKKTGLRKPAPIPAENVEEKPSTVYTQKKKPAVKEAKNAKTDT